MNINDDIETASPSKSDWPGVVMFGMFCATVVAVIYIMFG